MSFDDAVATTQVLQLDLSQTPRVLLVDDDELVLAGLEAGADDYLGKRASSAQRGRNCVTLAS